MDTRKLLSKIQKSANLNTNQNTYNEETILDFAHEEMINTVKPFINGADRTFFVQEIKVSLEAGEKTYTIPSRASGYALKEILYLDDSNTLYNIGQIEESVRVLYDNDLDSGDRPYYFYIRNNDLVLIPYPETTSGSLVVSYFQLPSEFVLPDEVASIVAINKEAGTITLNSVPEILSNSSKIDILSESGNKTKRIDLQANIDEVNSIITLDDLSGLKLGDQVSAAGTTAVLQIPDEAATLLAACVVRRIFEAQRDLKGVSLILNRIEEIKKNVRKVFLERVQGETPRSTSIHSMFNVLRR